MRPMTQGVPTDGHHALNPTQEDIMSQLKPIGLLLLALFVLGAFAASAASAEEGFLPKQNLGNLLGGQWIEEVEGGSASSCKKLDESHISFVNDKHGTGTLHFLECLFGNTFPINSLGDASGIILIPVEVLVCLDAKNAKGELLSTSGVATEVKGVHVEVPALGALFELNGRWLGTFTTTGQVALWGLKIEGAKGKQTVTSCLEGASTKEETFTRAENHGAAKPASANLTAALLQFPNSVILED
jgi:hypothetical protein